MRDRWEYLFHEDFSRFAQKFVDSLDESSISYWSSELNCSPELLAKAISQVGNNVMLINDWLILNRLRNEFNDN
ncbi:MAG: DUF3606 domain-containing protein [Sediminibacterium sp.]|nr:DUF3606 domain-containing protein [Sediminibacterium sp.]